MSVRRLKRLMRRPDSTMRGDSGQTLVEYALIIALVSLAAIAALGFLSGRIQNVFSKAGNSLNSVNVASGTGTGTGTGTGGPSPTAPVNTGAPAITCTGSRCSDCDFGSDDQMSTTQGTWSDGGAPPITGYSYQWYQQDDGGGDSCAVVSTDTRRRRIRRDWAQRQLDRSSGSERRTSATSSRSSRRIASEAQARPTRIPNT